MSTVLSKEEEALFIDNLRKFLNRELLPHYEKWEKDGIFPREVWNRLGEAGYLCVDIPEKYGGFGVDFRLSAIINQELARASMSVLSTSVAVHSDIVAPYILHLGTEEQKQTWLPGMVSGAAVGAIAMTEPGAGSDLQGMSTQARKSGENYLINGQKTFITNGQHCDVLVLAARTDSAPGAKSLSLFTIDTTLPGFQRGGNLEKIGMHCADTSELFFENLEVPETQILGGAGKGFANLMNELPRERLILAVGAIGACDGMLEWTLAYVTDRKVFGQAVARFQNTRFKLAELKTQIEVNRAFVESCIEKYMTGTLSAVEASMAKLSTTELQGKVADECLQLFGGYGYMREYPISRAFVDARVQRIYGGTSEIMKEIISRSLLGR